MKIILNLLVAITFVVAELPPPYQARGFRPNQPLLLPSQLNQKFQPQTSYGVPRPPPSKQYVPSSHQTTLNSHSTNVQRLHTQYGEPENRNIEPLNIQNLPRPDPAKFTGLGAQTNVQRLHSEYGVPIQPENKNIEPLNLQNLPRLHPAKFRGLGLQNQFGVAAENSNTRQNNLPQTSYGASLTQPQSSYVSPEPLNQFQRPATKLNQINQANQNLNGNENVPTVQYLPVLEPTDFRRGFLQDYKTIRLSDHINFNENVNENDQNPRASNIANGNIQPTSIDVRRLNADSSRTLHNQNSLDIQKFNVRRLHASTPSSANAAEIAVLGQNNVQSRGNPRESTEARNDLSSNQFPENKYLPPTSTRRPQPAIRPTEATVRDTGDEGTAETDDSRDNPNVSIATAFASRLFLLQPDGSLQMLPYQKPNQKSELKLTNENGGFLANYQLPNFQTLPLYNLNVPIYAFGK